MIKLQEVDYNDISNYFVDFQKHSNCFELPADSTQNIGIFKDNELIGYFIVQGYDGKEVEIHQGYLKPQYRHSDLPKDCMKLLEEGCKKDGYKKMLLGTHNRFRSYLKFAKSLGYKPQHLTFSKEI